MRSNMIFSLALVLFVGPPAAIFVWKQVEEYNHLRSIPPYELPGRVIMVHSPSCGPCQAMMPSVQKLQNSGYRIQTVNVRTEPSAAQQWNARYYPTFIFLQDGVEKYRSAGSLSQAKLEQLCRGIY